MAFHGYGQQAKVFEPFALDAQIYTINLPYHEHSDFALYQSKEEFLKVFNVFFAKYKGSKFNVIAFSIGCRLAYTLLAYFPQHLTSLTLLAPEGLVFHPIYRFATQNMFGNWLFKKSVDHASSLISSITLLERWKIFPKSLTRMAKSQLRTEQHRERLVRTWEIHRDFKPSIEELALNIKRYGLKIKLVLGKKDTIIRYKQIEPLCKLLEDYPYELQVMDCGHFDLMQTYFKRVKL